MNTNANHTPKLAVDSSAPVFGEQVTAYLRDRFPALVYYVHMNEVVGVGECKRDSSSISGIGVNHGVYTNLGNRQYHLTQDRMFFAELPEISARSGTHRLEDRHI